MSGRAAQSKNLVRHWRQLSLRTLFALVTVSGLLVAPFAYELHLQQRERAAIAQVEAVGGRVWFRSRDTLIARYFPGLLRSLGGIGDQQVVGVSFDGFDPGSADLVIKAADHFSPLADLPGLQIIYLSEFSLSDQDRQFMHPGVKKVEFRGEKFVDADLRLVRGLPKLKSLALYGGMTENGFDQLPHAAHLEELTIGGIRSVAEKGWRSIGECKQLRTLSVQGVSIGGKGMEHLAKLAHLERLNVESESYSPCSEDGRQISRCKSLRVLSLRDCSLTQDGIAAMVQHLKLREIYLAGVQLSDGMVRDLSQLKSLKTLSVKQTGIRDEHLAHIATMKGLESLEIVEVAYSGRLPTSTITDSGIKHLEAMCDLESLSLTSLEITDASVPVLANLPRLKTLTLQTKITPAGRKKLPDSVRVRP